MEQNIKTLDDYLDILKRRKWSLLLPAFAIVLLAAVVALVLPPIYQSTSTILIEAQEIPPEFVKTTVTSFAEQRLQTINQRIMSYSRLLEIINRFNLYPELRKKKTTEEIVDKMRKDVKMETISAEVKDRRSRKENLATIAFTLSYEGKDPEKVYQVANVLASLYLEENLRVREQQALGTSQFLQEEMKQVRVHLTELEAAIASFKEKHINELPELLQVNIQSLERTEQTIAQLEEQVRALRKQETYLQSQLAGMSPGLLKGDLERLQDLKVQLVHLKSRFSEQYPSVKKVRAEIAQLESRLQSSTAGGSQGQSSYQAADASQPDNPAYITLQAQLTTTRTDINSLKRQVEDLQKRRLEYNRRIEATPMVEKAYKALLIERDNTQAKYNDLMRKYMEADVAHGLEKEQKGERFTIIDTARLPEKPIKPNRLVILLVGVVLGMGAGVGTAALREFGDHSVRSAESLSLATSFPVLAVIPDIVTRKDILRRRARRAALAVTVVLVMAVGVTAFHYLVMDLNVFWAKVLRRLGV
ncbi:MAG: chain-length determining protein [Deltaproteobacteria bacterium]|nr:chain-length determining protein [Deltaproteobacteria bacterium]